VTLTRAEFDVCGPLPEGLTLLEASAGTGKTFTIAALVARYIADGMPIDQLLVVTFTKSATSELRERVRERLVETEAGLRRHLDGGTVGGDDVTELLTRGSGDEVEARRGRVAAALADFDAATIATTHGFCEQILAGLGTTGDVERDVTFVADQSDLVTEVIDDLFLAAQFETQPPAFNRTVGLAVGRTAVANPEAPVTPALDLAGYPVPVRRAEFARDVRAELTARKLRHATMGYDDLLTRLAETLNSPQGPAACLRLRERYRVVLVDEFQDTDPVQWDILRLAFATSTLVLIGDPKQAIYSFRGADVYSYLEAASLPSVDSSTLGVNWRSDQRLLDALDALFDGVTLGDGKIAYHDVRAAPGVRSRLEDAPSPTPLRARVLDRSDDTLKHNRDRARTIQIDAARAAVAADLANDIVSLLLSGATLVEPAPDGRGTVRKRVGPADIAVLVRTNAEADVVQGELRGAGVPVVIAGTGSVFATDVARQWLVLLQALERPANRGRALAAALTCFCGWRPADIGHATEADLADLQKALHVWADVLGRDGVASLLELVTVEQRLPARLLACDNGERQLTDLRHVGQLLHAEAVQARLGTNALTAWLRLRIAEAGGDSSAEDRLRRLESDSDAVVVITIYRSKGLEWPIVYLPYLWAGMASKKAAIPVYHDPDNGDRRTLDAGGKEGPQYDAHARLDTEEEAGEQLRLAYVALTRARHQVVVWWAASQDSHRAALTRLLLRADDGTVPPEKVPKVPSDDDVVARLEELAASTGGQIAVQRFRRAATSTWSVPSARPPTLEVRHFTRRLDTSWRRASYSAITDPVHGQPGADPRVASEPDEAVTDDEAMPDVVVADAPVPTVGPDLRAVASPMADLPGGATFGTLVHAVLETVDFHASGLDADLLRGVREASAGHTPIRGLDPVALAAALRTAIDTPLGPIADNRALRAFPKGDRLDELDFELPLVGGDEPVSELSVAAIAERLRIWLPADNPLASYPDRLDDPALGRKLHGYLAGSIDLLLRVRDDGVRDDRARDDRARGGDGARFVVVDYKTNRLAGRDEPLTAWHYRPEAMAEAMQAAHYPLQALIYSVAVHRYLRWRQPDYSPERHLGGVAYLFLRGMSGVDTPTVDGTPVGVFAWTPPPGLITDLSDLFDRGPATS
jgi:exodeoxyribonuclease V beta subunit